MKRYMNYIYAFCFFALGIAVIVVVAIDIRRMVREDRRKEIRIKKMNEEQLDDWWKHLHIIEKERIATKANRNEYRYPQCSFWWNKISVERKKEIYDHCTDRHGLLLEEWRDGKSMSY